MKYLLIFFIASICIISNTYAQSEGAPITIKASPAVSISGYPMEFSGNTLIGKEVLPVFLTVITPDGVIINLKDTTDKKGDYSFTYSKAFATGVYKVVAATADEKTTDTATFTVTTISGAINDIQNDFFKVSEFVQRSFDEVLIILEAMPPSPDIDVQINKIKSLKPKIPELKKNEEKMSQALKDLVKATTDIPQLAVYTRDFIDKIQDANKEFLKKLPVMNAKVESYRNESKLCEMINNMMEVSGFVSLALDFKSKVIKTIILNLSSDKFLPGVLDRIVTKGGPEQKEHVKMVINTSQKTAIAAAGGASSVASFIGSGLSLDVGTYIGKILYAQNCKELKGKTLTTFTASFKAGNGEIYAQYEVELTGEMKLRYNLKADISKGAEIYGEIMGYRTKYKFKEDFEQVEKVPAGMSLLARLKYTPLRNRDNTSFNGDIGAIAMAMIPGSFRVSLKGKVIGDKLTLEVINSPFDQTEGEENNRLFVILINGMLPIPLIYKFEVPIAKNKIIFKVALPKEHVFKMVKDKKVVTVTETALSNTREPGEGIILKTKLSMALSNE